jgi:hypothetical protein
MSHTYNTEIIYGLDTIVERTLKRLSQANKKIDACISGAAIAGIVKAKPVFDITVSLKKKGVKIRYVTEITRQNILYVKELMKTAEFRHMDGIKGNYSIVDGIDYQATAAVDEGEGPTESVLSTARAFVDQQQFVFDMLWKKSISAKQRINEIEEGLKREFIETIQDQSEIKKLITDLITSAVEEINIVFPTKNLFYKFEKEKLFELIKKRVLQEEELTIKVLTDPNIDLINTMKTLSLHHQKFELGFTNEKIRSQVIIIIIDNEYVLAIESKDISNNVDDSIDEDNDTAIAIYSNSKYTVMSYISISETLWIRAASNKQK